MAGGAMMQMSHDTFVPTPLLYLDAKSYQGSGTTWSADNGSDATLVNTPSHIAPSPSYFRFNANNSQKATGSDLGNLSNWTVECWFRLTSSPASHITALITDQWDYSTKLNYCLGINPIGGAGQLQVGFFNGSWHLTSGFIPSQNTWYQCVGSFDGDVVKQYSDGYLHSSTNYTGTTQSSGLGYRIAGRWDSQVAGTDFFPGDIGLIRVWNSALSPAQIIKLYNRNRPRFSLTPTITSFTDTGDSTWVAPPGVSTVEYLVVGGGGGAGNGYDNAGGGGGGGGMVLANTTNVISGTTYGVTVGSGGTGGANARANYNGTAGSNSVFSSITALGGGGGGGSRTGGTNGAAQVGSSTAPTGGSGTGGGSGGKGGGGASGAGSNNSGTGGGAGGAGVTTTISGSSVTYGAGGAGANSGVQNAGVNGTVNTGNGGRAGGATSANSTGGGNGGSGIVIVKYGS